MIPGLLYAIVLPAAVTYSALRLAGVGRALALALAPGLGLGIASTLYFFLLFTRPAEPPVLLDALVWLMTFGGLMFAWSRRKRRTPTPSGVDDRPGRRQWTPLLAVAVVGCIGLLVLAVVAIWLDMRLTPHGLNDGIAIWNLRARSLSRGTPEWPAILSPAIGWSHPDYPLLLPLTVARLWSYAGSETTAVPQFTALLFFGSSVATVGVSVGYLCGATAGLLSAMTVVAARTYVFQVSCQCADVPIGFFILVATVFLVLARESDLYLLVAGAAAGLAAWTKNEGQLLVVVIAAFAVIASGNRLRRLGLLLAGGAVPLVALAVFKLLLAPPDLFRDQPGDAIVDKLFDVARWRLVLTETWVLLQRWGNVPGGALFWSGVAIALAARPDRPGAVRSVFGTLVITTVLGGYLAAYAITPLPLSWHIATSFERLVVQLWPAAVWSAFQLTAGHRVFSRTG
jgi:hypothetical protein